MKVGIDLVMGGGEYLICSVVGLIDCASCNFSQHEDTRWLDYLAKTKTAFGSHFLLLKLYRCVSRKIRFAVAALPRYEVLIGFQILYFGAVCCFVSWSFIDAI